MSVPARTAPVLRVDLGRPVVFLVGAVVAGLLGGAVTFWAQGVLPQWLSLWANSLAPWAAFALAAGVVAPRAWCAVVGGVLTQWGLVVGYYQLSDTQTAWWNRFDSVWLAAGVFSGVAFGLLGWWCRSDRTWLRTLAIAVLPGLAIGSGIEFALRTEEHYEGLNVIDGLSMVVVALAVVAAVRGTARERSVRLGTAIVIGLAVWAFLVWVFGPLLDAVFLSR